MQLSVSNAMAPRGAVRLSPVMQSQTAIAPPTVPAINTILAVREHAPAEIEELDTLIQTLHQRLGSAYARKRLLEQLLTVIHEAESPSATPATGMTVVR